MSDPEYLSWQAANDRIKRLGWAKAKSPCTDCPAEFAVEMRAKSRCDGIPGDDGRAEAVRRMAHARAIASAARAEKRQQAIEQARALLADGRSVREIASTMSVSDQTIYRYLSARAA